MKLEEISTGASLSGVEPTQIVSVVATMAGMPDTAKNLQAHLEGFTNATDLDVKLVDSFRLQLNGSFRTLSRIPPPYR